MEVQTKMLIYSSNIRKTLNDVSQHEPRFTSDDNYLKILVGLLLQEDSDCMPDDKGSKLEAIAALCRESRILDACQ